ncbi:DltD N-terminal domain protein [Daldinia vernicosa]|uniref:DltD N-terminal domain protein n=1 Tax=Daldinia vernicosa TaxID=114800 RepID=UPI0020081BE3|nr:DltD N-terminal domain protein [Daldinia vernicosa]KAI0853136.1 DltD N-terminal domain protein [Daldinia vernicosa]
MGAFEDVEFQTIDGLTLRGRVYHADQRGPAIIMCPGFNCVLEMAGLPAVAEGFQTAGITVLLYDPRSVGASDGQPRNDIDPFKQVQDYSDALTFLKNLSTVEPRQIGFWGTSLSASIALSAAAFDKRAKLVIAASPVAEYHYNNDKMQQVLRTCLKDRESQIKGNPPFYIPMIDEFGQNPAGLDFGYNPEKAAAWSRSGMGLASNHVNRTTIQSYHKLAMWVPGAMWKHIDQTPVLFLIPETDRICPPEEQLRHFNNLKGPKKSYVRKGKGHMNLLEGEHVDELIKLQVDFIRDAIEGRAF